MTTESAKAGTPRTQAMMEKAAQHVMDKMPITGSDAVIAFMDSVTDEVQAMERELDSLMKLQEHDSRWKEKYQNECALALERREEAIFRAETAETALATLRDEMREIVIAVGRDPEGDWHRIAEDVKALAACRKDAERYRWLRDLSSNQMYLTHNEHAANYDTAEGWMDNMTDWFANDPPESVAEMKATNSIWTLQIYPSTPIGFNLWNRATLDEVIDAALDMAAQERTG